jgi:hypothetical protein
MVIKVDSEPAWTPEFKHELMKLCIAQVEEDQKLIAAWRNTPKPPSILLGKRV